MIAASVTKLVVRIQEFVTAQALLQIANRRQLLFVTKLLVVAGCYSLPILIRRQYRRHQAKRRLDNGGKEFTLFSVVSMNASICYVSHCSSVIKLRSGIHHPTGLQAIAWCIHRRGASLHPMRKGSPSTLEPNGIHLGQPPPRPGTSLRRMTSTNIYM